MQPPYLFTSITALMRHLDQPAPLHPLIALVPSGNVPVKKEDIGRGFITQFYKVSFKIDFKGKIPYGHGYYDFEEGGLSFTAPNQLSFPTGDTNHYEGYTLFFHPDLMRGKPMAQYGFFSYSVSEALYLSDKERKVILGIFEAMALELSQSIDHFSQDVIVTQIELLLNYSNRFYNRQFITRKIIYHDLIGKMYQFLEQRSGDHLPTVQDVADQLQVSPRYLSDLLKSLTGMSTQQHIHQFIIDKAKDILSASDMTIAEIAYQLGFEHPQSFNKLFKQKTQLSPIAYRQGLRGDGK